MYGKKDYIKRGLRFVNNIARPGHKKLSTLMIYATDFCDSECKHCLIWAKRPVRHLPFKKIVEIMGSRCVSKDTVVGLEGGEFLMHPEAYKIMEWFTKNHPNFDLLTNCLKPDNVIQAVTKFPPKRLFLSLDGTKETYQYMRGKDGYDGVLKVIEACRNLVPISAMFTLSPYNSFADLEHVIEICKKYDIDIRIGVYNDIEFFNTVEKAHETEIAEVLNNQEETARSRKEMERIATGKNELLNKLEYENLEIAKHDETRISMSKGFKELIPDSVKGTTENYDFLLLYDEWRRKNTKMKCYSILDSVVVHPNGNVPICQNLEIKLGNVMSQSLDEIINSVSSQKLYKEYTKCNQCWINFHRKYDVVMLRTLERFFPKNIIELIYGKYQWCFDPKMSYKEFMMKYE